MWEILWEKAREGLGALGRGRKKVLALVLTLALALSVAAGAAFTDQKQIKNTEAVDMCVALNIISGYPDGSYKPEGNITRAEFTKMLCVLLNGGNTPATATKATPTFSDIRTSANASWAEGFIEYCYAKGIVSGVGDGKFNPNGNITATEAAKMLLVALGYNADVESYTGAAWALKVNVQANQDGLYKDLEKIDTNAALTRDNAAQMVWNALQAYVIDKSSSIDRTDGSITDIYTKSTKVDLLEKMYKGDIFEGTLSSFTFDSNKDKWTYVVTDKDQKTVKVTSKTDYTALLNQNVKAVYDATGKQPYDAYGIFAVDSEVVLTGLIGDLPDIANADKSFKVDGVKYTLKAEANTIDVKLFNSDTTKTLTAVAAEDVTAYDAQKFSAIDTDGDGDIDYFMVVPYAVAQVKYVGSDSFRVAIVADPFNTFSTSNPTFDFDDVTTYDKMAKNDYVVMVADTYTGNDTATFTKADLVKGKIVSKDGEDVSIDGTWYTVDKSYVDAKLAYTAGTTLTDAVVVNGYIFDADASGAKAVTDYVVVVSGNNDGYGSTVKLMFSDGTKKVVDLDKFVGVPNVTNEYDPDVKGMLFTYDVNSDDEYKLTKASVEGTGFDKAIGSTTYDGTYAGKVSAISNSSTKAGYIDGASIANDAVIFVKYTEDGSVKYKVVSGEQLKKTAATDLSCVYMLASDGSGNVKNVEMAYVTAQSDVSSADSYYGYVTSVVSIEDAYQITVWTKDGAKTYDTKNDNSQFAVSKRDVIEFKLNSDGEISEILGVANVATSTRGTAFGSDYACTIGIVDFSNDTLRFKAFAGNKITDTVEVSETQANKYFEADDDMVTLFIENSDAKGLETGTIDSADDAATENALVPNAFVVWDKDGSILLMVYDVDNDINK